MAICKCKMCGGDLCVTELDKVAVCEYCGTKQTVPGADSEKKMQLYNRANRLRRGNEFDAAAALYEQIAAEFPEESEAYWGLCLCNYGIEYVDDPATGKKMPTCHRASFEKLAEDENFSLAMEYADVSAKKLFRAEAREIDRINDEILSISRNESPYDIFICYKETDAAGERTPDSVLAQEIYDALTAKGYKVFFSRITLEDKLGLQYEPYIFAALNSARIMLAVGTDYEYFHAVWVQNEWRRFLRLASKDKRKILIPCYRDMDPYDMPDAFRGLQAQDMNKLGAMQDLVRGVEKLLPKTASPAAPAVISAPAVSAAQPLLTRAFIYLEDGNWSSADEYAEKALDVEPKNGEAYLAKAMAKLQVKARASLCEVPAFETDENTQKALRFGDDAVKAEIEGYILAIREAREARRRMEEERRKAEEARISAQKAQDEADAEEVLRTLGALRGSGFYEDEVLLIRTNENVAVLQALSRSYDGIPALIAQKQASLNAMRERAASLNARRSALGVFSGKEKKQIDDELNSLHPQIGTVEEEIAGYAGQLARFKSREALETALREQTALAQEQAAQLSEKKSGIVRAFQMMRDNERVRALVMEKEPLFGNTHNFSVFSGIYGLSRDCLFGRYPQNVGEAAPIEWIVLQREENRVLLISKYALDCQPFHCFMETKLWKTCSLRGWLNSDFLAQAFNDDERKLILPTALPELRSTSSVSDDDLTDRIFLLSTGEAKSMFASDADRKCRPTQHAYGRGAVVRDSSCIWWLRSTGVFTDHAARVDFSGAVDMNGAYMDYVRAAVRPAMWIGV